MSDQIIETADVENVPAAPAEPTPVTSITCYTPDGGQFECPLHKRITNAFHKAFTSAVRAAQEKGAAVRREFSPVMAPLVASRGEKLTDEEKLRLRKYSEENLAELDWAGDQMALRTAALEDELHAELSKAIIARHELSPTQIALVDGDVFWDLQDREEWAKAIVYFRRRLGV